MSWMHGRYKGAAVENWQLAHPSHMSVAAAFGLLPSSTVPLILRRPTCRGETSRNVADHGTTLEAQYRGGTKAACFTIIGRATPVSIRSAAD